MARPLRIQYPGAYYYVTQHSNADVSLYKSDADRKKFIELLESSMTTYGVNLHCFALLKRHFHLLVETPRGNLSEFMRHLNISYTSYFNRLYSRKGHLYGGRFKSIVLEKDLFIAVVSLYLHLNPVNTGAGKRIRKDNKLEYLSTYKWSSLPGYLGIYPRYHFIHHHEVLKSYGGDTPQGRMAYNEALAEQLNSGLTIKTGIVGQTVLGSLPFLEKMQNLTKRDAANAQLPASQQIGRFLKQEKVIAELLRSLQCERSQLLTSPGDMRSITMDMLYRFAGMTNPLIGDLMGLDYTSISSGRKRLRQKRSIDHKLNARITLLEKRLERQLNTLPE